MAVTSAPNETITVLYDRDCGFCRWSLAKILGWDRARRLRPRPIQGEEGQRLLTSIAEERRLRSWHVVHPDGRIESTAPALATVLDTLPGGAPMAKLTRAFPRAAHRAYMLVAANRSALGKPITKRMKLRATDRIRERETDPRS
jgi:predicted DCC family thiol-disulfide oxidoreductase YuxK